MTSCLSQMCGRFDSHGKTSMVYWFVDPVDASHGGTYTCRAQDGATKSVDVSVQGRSSRFGKLLPGVFFEKPSVKVNLRLIANKRTF